MTQPDFRTLPEIPGNPGVRIVGSTFMDEEQYTVEGWHLDKGEWRATLAGLRRYGQLIASRRDERIAAARTRRESDDEWSSHVQSLIDAKEYGP